MLQSMHLPAPPVVGTTPPYFSAASSWLKEQELAIFKRPSAPAPDAPAKRLPAETPVTTVENSGDTSNFALFLCCVCVCVCVCCVDVRVAMSVFFTARCGLKLHVRPAAPGRSRARAASERRDERRRFYKLQREAARSCAEMTDGIRTVFWGAAVCVTADQHAFPLLLFLRTSEQE